MGKSNLYSNITIAVVSTLLLCSCVDSITVDPVVGGIDYSVDGEPEVIQEIKEEAKSLTIDQKKKQLISIYSSYIGVREKTGKNDGSEVERFLAHEGLGKGYAWCAAFVSFCLDSAGFKNSINAWSPTAHNRNALIYNKGKFVGTPEPGHVFTIYYPKKKRIGHTGFYDGWASENIMQTVEGNTNDRKSREGDGVYVILRPINTIHSISSWYE
jgi:hypothetical protein